MHSCYLPTTNSLYVKHHTEKQLVTFLKSLVWFGLGWIRTLDLPISKRTLYHYTMESVHFQCVSVLKGPGSAAWHVTDPNPRFEPNRSNRRYAYSLYNSFSFNLNKYIFKIYPESIEYLRKKKFYDRTRIRVYGFHSWLKLHTCFLIGGYHKNYNPVPCFLNGWAWNNWISKRFNYLNA